MEPEECSTCISPHGEVTLIFYLNPFVSFNKTFFLVNKRKLAVFFFFIFKIFKEQHCSMELGLWGGLSPAQDLKPSYQTKVGVFVSSEFRAL